MATTLESVEQLIDELTAADQARLLGYLAPKVADAVLQPNPAEPPIDPDQAWRNFCETGKRVAALVPPGVSVADVLSEMRR